MAETIEEELAALDKKIQDGTATTAEQERFNHLLENFDRYEWKNPKNPFLKPRFRVNRFGQTEMGFGGPVAMSVATQQTAGCSEFKNIFYNCADLPWDATDPWNRTSDAGDVWVRACGRGDACASGGVLGIDSNEGIDFWRLEERLLDERFVSAVFRTRQTISEKNPDANGYGGGLVWIDDGVKSTAVGFLEELSGAKLVVLPIEAHPDPVTGDLGITEVLSAYFDWSAWHEYRLVKDSNGMVALFADGDPTPVLSYPYASLNMPTFGGPAVMFGSSVDGQNSRVLFEVDYFDYSVGMLNTDGCSSAEGKMKLLSLLNIDRIFKPGCMQNEIVGMLKITPVGGMTGAAQSQEYYMNVERSLRDATGAVVRTLKDTVQLGQLGGGGPTEIRADGVSTWDGTDGSGNEVAEGSFTYDVTFSVVRADKKAKEKVLSSISATGSPVIMTQSIPFGLPAPIYTYCRDTDLRRAVAPWTDPASEAPLSTEWNYSDNIRHLWGKDLKIRPADVGCMQSNRSEAVKCVLLHFSTYVGLTAASDIEFEHETVEPDGDHVFRYHQLFSGLPVDGSYVVVTTTTNGALTSVFSTAIAGITGDVGAPATSLSAGESPRVAAEATEQAGGVPLIIVEDFPIVWIDRATRNTRARPARKLTLADPAGQLYDALLVLDENRLVTIKSRAKAYAGRQMNYTKLIYPEHTTTLCSGGWAVPPYTCDKDNWPWVTVKKCSWSGDCPWGWHCWDNSRDHPGYCFLQDATDASNGLLFYTGDGGSSYTSDGYSLHELFVNLVDAMWDVQDFQYLDLDRAGWDNGNGPYKTILVANCCGPNALECDVGENCGWSGLASGDGKVWISEWPPLKRWGTRQSDDDRLAMNYSYHLLGHEWTHNMVDAIVGPYGLTNSDCVNENVAEMFGTLLAVKILGGSDNVINWDCGVRTIKGSAWSDDTAGASPFCGMLSYAALRSRFDWQSCTPPDGDIHNNNSVWNRFLRVLTEGANTFAKDGNGEVLGVSLTGLGWNNTKNVVYDAVLNSSASGTLKDWVQALKSAGYKKGFGSRVQTALGIAGFVGYSAGLQTAPQSDQALNGHRFTSWTGSQSKEFYVWKDKNSTNIKVGYHIGSTFTTYTFAANTDVSPAVVEFNNRLHIFWRDKDTKGINLRWITSDGNKSMTYFLGSKGLYSAGGFDAAVFNGKLYLVYVDPTESHVRLAKCSAPTTSGCGATGFTNPSGGANYVDLGFKAYPGLAAAAGSGLNGTSSSSTPYLYIVSAINESTDRYRIRVDQVNIYDTMQHQGFTVKVPSPSKTNGQIAARLFKSAFNNP